MDVRFKYYLCTMKTKTIQYEFIKHCRKLSREEEIENHGKQIGFRVTKTQNKKKYDRNKNKKKNL